VSLLDKKSIVIPEPRGPIGRRFCSPQPDTACAAKPQILGCCITWHASLLSSFCWYSLRLPPVGWPGWVVHSGWLNTKMVIRWI